MLSKEKNVNDLMQREYSVVPVLLLSRRHCIVKYNSTIHCLMLEYIFQVLQNRLSGFLVDEIHNEGILTVLLLSFRVLKL